MYMSIKANLRVPPIRPTIWRHLAPIEKGVALHLQLLDEVNLHVIQQTLANNSRILNCTINVAIHSKNVGCQFWNDFLTYKVATHFVLLERFKIHIYAKWQTSDSSWEFLRIENKQIKTVQNNSYV